MIDRWWAQCLSVVSIHQLFEGPCSISCSVRGIWSKVHSIDAPSCIAFLLCAQLWTEEDIGESGLLYCHFDGHEWKARYYCILNCLSSDYFYYAFASHART